MPSTVTVSKVIRDEIARSKHEVFRRLYFKTRDVTTGAYGSWEQIPDIYVQNWGSIDYSVDVKKPFYFKPGNLVLKVLNNDGAFNNTDDLKSVFYESVSRYKTMVKIEAGYYDSNKNELEYLYNDTNSTVFVGIMNDEFNQDKNNNVTFQIQNLTFVFQDYAAQNIDFSTTSLAATASNILGRIRDWTDGSGNFIFRQYISQASWSIQSTTKIYPDFNTSTIADFSIWDLMKKLSESENFVVYVDQLGRFKFKDRDIANVSIITSEAPTTTVDFKYHFSGIGEFNSLYGHNIISRVSIKEPLSKTYNRIRIKYAEADTTTSYEIYEEDWTWGDSSSSFRFGVRTLNFDNQWLNASESIILAEDLFNEFKEPTQEVKLEAKFLGNYIDLFYPVTVTYKTTEQGGDGSVWGTAIWDSSLWGKSGSRNIDIDNQPYYVIGINHDLNNFKSSFNLRYNG